jgi:eukaryotic-like serine/threonine-protein kinase
MSAAKLCPQCGSEYDEEQRFCPRDGSTLRRSDPASDLAGQVVADRYHVLRKLGEGGMGQVWLAEHVKMGRKSALKVMHPSMGADADAISRFNREATNASRVSHPNVCAIYDFGETPEGMIWLAMEYVDGEPLTRVIERSGALPAPRAAELVRQTAAALAAAHELGIVHRDLKPDNIMVARGRDGADVVKVVDFGIAKAAAADVQQVTRTGLVVGTPEYMSPEQLAGDRVDARSDIYALGLVAFTMLTGALPFPSRTVQEAMIMRLTERPRTLAEMRPGVDWPAALQRALDRALARDAAERPASAADFAAELRSAADAMPEAALAVAGTRAMSAPAATGAEPLPATRVSPAAPRPASAADARTTAPLRRAPLVAALAIVAAASIGGVLLATRRGGAAGEASPVASAPAPSLALAAAGDSDTATGARADSARVGERAPSRAATDVTEAPAARRLDARGELDAMKRVIDRALDGAIDGGPDAATRVALERVARDAETLLPRIASDTDIGGVDAEAFGVDAQFFRAVALGLLGDSGDETCALLGRIRGRAGRLTSAGEIAQLYGSFCRSA